MTQIEVRLEQMFWTKTSKIVIIMINGDRQREKEWTSLLVYQEFVTSYDEGNHYFWRYTCKYLKNTIQNGFSFSKITLHKTMLVWGLILVSSQCNTEPNAIPLIFWYFIEQWNFNDKFSFISIFRMCRKEAKLTCSIVCKNHSLLCHVEHNLLPWGLKMINNFGTVPLLNYPFNPKRNYTLKNAMSSIIQIAWNTET